MLRTILSATVMVALAVGYFASQTFALSGRAAEWTARIDTHAIVWAALLVLLLGLALWLIPAREESD